MLSVGVCKKHFHASSWELPIKMITFQGCVCLILLATSEGMRSSRMMGETGPNTCQAVKWVSGTARLRLFGLWQRLQALLWVDGPWGASCLTRPQQKGGLCPKELILEASEKISRAGMTSRWREC